MKKRRLAAPRLKKACHKYLKKIAHKRPHPMKSHALSSLIVAISGKAHNQTPPLRQDVIPKLVEEFDEDGSLARKKGWACHRRWPLKYEPASTLKDVLSKIGVLIWVHMYSWYLTLIGDVLSSQRRAVPSSSGLTRHGFPLGSLSVPSPLRLRRIGLGWVLGICVLEAENLKNLIQFVS